MIFLDGGKLFGILNLIDDNIQCPKFKTEHTAIWQQSRIEHVYENVGVTDNYLHTLHQVECVTYFTDGFVQ
jgi:hypothetical protein